MERKLNSGVLLNRFKPGIRWILICYRDVDSMIKELSRADQDLRSKLRDRSKHGLYSVARQKFFADEICIS